MMIRVPCLFSIGVMLIVMTAWAETAKAQVVVGGQTYVQVPNGAYFYRTPTRPVTGVFVGYPYGYYPNYYVPYVQRPYYPPYGTHYYPYPSYYYAPNVVRYRNQWNYRRR